MKYILGVDGGNTKTDYLLYDTEGNFIDGLRSGTCSHEGLKDGFEGSYNVMNARITELLSRNGLTVQDIEASAMGLAGIDCSYQKEQIDKVIERIGLKNCQAVNDGFLGIKAASPNGTGACSINGTGTVSVCINEKNEWKQVGGIGYVAGDEGGGSYLARTVVRAVFDYCFRFGPATSLVEDVYEMYGISSKDQLASAIITKRVDSTFLIKALFKRANEKDLVSMSILDKVGENMARSTAGAIVQVELPKPTYVILAGSVWANATNKNMIVSFVKKVNELTKRECEFIILKEPPVLGAIYWAMELANKVQPTQKQKEKIKVSMQKYQSEQR